MPAPQCAAFTDEVGWEQLEQAHLHAPRCFDGTLPNPRALRVADAFVVKCGLLGQEHTALVPGWRSTKACREGL